METYFYQWTIGKWTQPAVRLPLPCESFEQAAAIVVARHRPTMVKSDSRVKIYQGSTAPDANYAMFTLGKVKLEGLPRLPTSPAVHSDHE